MTLRPGSQARLDQLDAQVDQAVRLVLDGLRATEDDEPGFVADLSAMNVGVALRYYIDTLDEGDVRMLAAHAVVRLAQARQEPAS